MTAVHAADRASPVTKRLALFIVFQGLTMACFAFTSSNLGTLAMEHMAPIAGTASSVQGVVGTVGAAILGFLIGQAFDGTVQPFLTGVALVLGWRVRAGGADRAQEAVCADRPEDDQSARAVIPDDFG